MEMKTGLGGEGRVWWGGGVAVEVATPSFLVDTTYVDVAACVDGGVGEDEA